MEPTQEELRRAAAAWQGQSSTPQCEDRSPYFLARWSTSDGLRKYVVAEMAKRKT